jgi:hypothetical protein
MPASSANSNTKYFSSLTIKQPARAPETVCTHPRTHANIPFEIPHLLLHARPESFRLHCTATTASKPKSIFKIQKNSETGNTKLTDTWEMQT